MKKKYIIIISILFIISFGRTEKIQAQQWGLYTFYSQQNGTTAYLIDTADTPATYKTWTFSSSKKTGYSSYLAPGATIYRSVANTGNTLSGGGMTGAVQKVDWFGNVVWDFVYSSSTYCMHHDICPMPNGNVLLISYEVKTAANATAVGCSQSIIIWSEKIIEVQPTGPTTGTIVWEWHLWDHLCQNTNSSLSNYVSSIVQNPQLMNINYNTQKDWFHMNGIDYNAALDQIVFSAHNMNEVYVIDHSTTTAQAATHSGGNSGKGGDFLYRWGNPASYGATGTTIFNVVHDAHWVPSNNPNYPNYLCAYNNKGGTGSNTAITIWNPPYNGSNYTLSSGSAYTPSTYAYQYSTVFAASNEGNSQQLPNGNILVANPTGSIYEVSPTGTTLWTKASASSPHAYRYDLCYVRGPLIKASASATQVVSGATDTLKVTAVSQTETNPTYSYSWSSTPAGFTSNQQNPVINPSSTAIYSVTVTNTAIGCSATANVNVTVSGSNVLACNPTATPNTVCAGDSVHLAANASGGSNYTYAWSSNPAGYNSTISNPTVTPTGNTTYTVVIHSGTDSVNSSANVTVNPLPATPNISQNGNILSASVANSYQWYYNNSIINGAVSQTYTATTAGNYQVVVGNNYNCTAMSSTFNFTPTEIISYAENPNLLVYPNPASQMIHIQTQDNTQTPLQISLYNLTGTLVLHSENQHDLDISKLSNGIYFISVIEGNHYFYNKKILIQR